MDRMFQSFCIKNVRFRSRVFRSSIGGRSAYYDGKVTPAWKNFEARFARPEYRIGAIISATIDVDEHRLSPLEYPKISEDRFMPALSEGVKAVQNQGCRYIMQIGDPGYHTQMSLLPEAADGKTASAGFDLVYGYRNWNSKMTPDEVQAEVRKFAAAARRVKEIGCDGIEITASKGYMIHQFLNPATNRRDDDYGGNFEKRFRLLKDVIQEARTEVGADYLLGVRLSAKDANWLPFNLRWPPTAWVCGNGIEQTLEYGRWLKKAGVDYLHIDLGFGFLNPLGSPGPYPLEGVKLFADATRHLSGKAYFRAEVLNKTPEPIARAVFGFGWKKRRTPSLDFAARFKDEIGLPVIANGGFQTKEDIEAGLLRCDAVAIARPLLANPDLLAQLQHANEPEHPCTFCSLCCTRTAVQPLGCYDMERYMRICNGNRAEAQRRMEADVLEWSANTD